MNYTRSTYWHTLYLVLVEEFCYNFDNLFCVVSEHMVKPCIKSGIKRGPRTVTSLTFHIESAGLSDFIPIYISLLPPWFGDLHTYVINQKNNNEKKVKMKQKKRTTNKNIWANNYIVRRVSRIRIERKDEYKEKWHICACYKMKHTGNVWQQEHTKVMETVIIIIMIIITIKW